MLAAGFAQMALAAALLHENIVAANPITVVAAIVRIGWAYLWPCLLAGIALAFTVLGVVLLLYKMPRMWMEARGAVDVLGARALPGHGVDPHDGADLPRPCSRPGLVQAPAAVGDVAASWAALRQFVRS